MERFQEPTASIDGLVVRKQLDRFEVLIQERRIPCRLSGALRHAAQKGQARKRSSADSVTVGDHVRIRPAGGADLIESMVEGLIVEVLPRRNRLARRAAGPKPVEQVLAANVDLAVLVFAAAEPKPRWTLLDRFLVQAEAMGIPPLICITKIDLIPAGALEEDLTRYREIGYPVVYTSVRPDLSAERAAESTRPVGSADAEGMEELSTWLNGKISVLVGKSGVGKSTLVNTLQSDQLPTAAISARTGKGRHTTSDAQMMLLPNGGGIVDTPGLREFGLWRIPAPEVARHFPEMREYLGSCRFRDGCSHSHEPGCEVKEAVRIGKIHSERYRSYLRIIGSDVDDQEEESERPPSRPSGGAAHSGGGSGGASRAYKHSANNERRGETTAGPFPCAHCGVAVPAEAPGTEHRNHCPTCLWSRHVDHRPGDRAAGCGGSMEPLAVAVRSNGEWTLLHRCQECGVIRNNRIAGDDNGVLLLSMAVRPLARPPFPLDRVQAGGSVG